MGEEAASFIDDCEVERRQVCGGEVILGGREVSIQMTARRATVDGS